MARLRGLKWQADVRTSEARLHPTFASKVDAELWEASARQAVSRGEPIPTTNGSKWREDITCAHNGILRADGTVNKKTVALNV